MNNKNVGTCFADKGFSKCSVLTSKDCNKCSFYKTVEQYRQDRLKYRDKEMVYLAKHGISYRGE